MANKEPLFKQSQNIPINKVFQFEPHEISRILPEGRVYVICRLTLCMCILPADCKNCMVPTWGIDTQNKAIANRRIENDG